MAIYTKSLAYKVHKIISPKWFNVTELYLKMPLFCENKVSFSLFHQRHG